MHFVNKMFFDMQSTNTKLESIRNKHVGGQYLGSHWE